MRALQSASLLFAVATLALSACDSSNVGQVTGTVSSQLSNAPESAQVALIWFTEDGEVLSSSTNVSGDFPASFTLDLSGPPPEGALLQQDGFPAVAAASVVALEGGATDLENAEVYGFSEDLVIYLAEDLAEGTPGAEELGAISAGYHILRIVEPSEDELAAIDACYEESAPDTFACEDACALDLDAQLDGCEPEDEDCFDAAFEGNECFDGCWGDDPCQELVDGAFGIEILPIDTPIELVLVDDLNDDDNWGDDFDDEFGQCLDEAFGQADECYFGCEDLLDLEGCEQLLEEGAPDEEIDACFNDSFGDADGCYSECDAIIEAGFENCENEFPPPPLTPEEEAINQCLDEQLGDIDSCYSGCEESYAGCEELFEDGSDEEIEECFYTSDEAAFECYEGCDGLMRDAFNACGVEYDC